MFQRLVVLPSSGLLLLSLALQTPMGFSLLSDYLPFCSFLTLLSPPFYSYYLRIFFNIYGPSLPWSSSNSRTYSLPPSSGLNSRKSEGSLALNITHQVLGKAGNCLKVNFS
jgi:hypothetical protein